MGALRWQKTVGRCDVTKLSVGEMDNNVYLLRVGDDVLLIDGANEADAILERVGDGSLSTIFQTHGHGDHIVALPDLVKATGARVLVHEADERRMPVPADRIAHGDTVSVGGVSLDVLHTPGHTPGSVCLVLREDGQTHLFSGDTLFPGGPGGTFGNKDAFATIMRSLEEHVFALPDDTSVYPGHGDDTTIGTERPSIEEWRARGW